MHDQAAVTPVEQLAHVAVRIGGRIDRHAPHLERVAVRIGVGGVAFGTGTHEIAADEPGAGGDGAHVVIRVGCLVGPVDHHVHGVPVLEAVGRDDPEGDRTDPDEAGRRLVAQVLERRVDLLQRPRQFEGAPAIAAHRRAALAHRHIAVIGGDQEPVVAGHAAAVGIGDRYPWRLPNGRLSGTDVIEHQCLPGTGAGLVGCAVDRRCGWRGGLLEQVRPRRILALRRCIDPHRDERGRVAGVTAGAFDLCSRNRRPRSIEQQALLECHQADGGTACWRCPDDWLHGRHSLEIGARPEHPEPPIPH